MHGTKVFRQTIAPYTTTLALPAIPSGVYIITVRSEGKSISQKIVGLVEVPGRAGRNRFKAAKRAELLGKRMYPNL